MVGDQIDQLRGERIALGLVGLPSGLVLQRVQRLGVGAL